MTLPLVVLLFLSSLGLLVFANIHEMGAGRWIWYRDGVLSLLVIVLLSNVVLEIIGRINNGAVS